MRRTTTIFLDFQRLQLAGQSAATVVKLMMACNDMQLANECLAGWKKQQPRSQKHREVGAKMYFLRLQISHLYEALKIVENIRQDKSLRRVVEQCDTKTKSSFRELEFFCPMAINANGWKE